MLKALFAGLLWEKKPYWMTADCTDKSKRTGRACWELRRSHACTKLAPVDARMRVRRSQLQTMMEKAVVMSWDDLTRLPCYALYNSLQALNNSIGIHPSISSWDLGEGFKLNGQFRQHCMHSPTPPLFSSLNSPQISLCKKKISHHIKMSANTWSTKC
jgi:hypothetical protein